MSKANLYPSSKPIRLELMLLLAVLLALTACTAATMHRPDSVERKDDFILTFIEFDDHGEPWAPAQLERTIKVIDEEHNTGKQTVVVLFVHGWQNDASKREDRKHDNNVEGFQRLLETTRQVMRRAGRGPDEVSLIGVYLSWRGRSTDVGLLKPMTFYSRRGAGQRAASVSTTEAILRVMSAAKNNPLSTGVVIGHSFGGMIVERALIQALVGYSLRQETEIKPAGDMVILINPASQSMKAKNMVSLLKRVSRGRRGESAPSAGDRLGDIDIRHGHGKPLSAGAEHQGVDEEVPRVRADRLQPFPATEGVLHPDRRAQPDTAQSCGRVDRSGNR
jgi:pimeloyl-ACP methyl ester carboxylesterase